MIDLMKQRNTRIGRVLDFLSDRETNEMLCELGPHPTEKDTLAYLLALLFKGRSDAEQPRPLSSNPAPLG